MDKLSSLETEKGVGGLDQSSADSVTSAECNDYEDEPEHLLAPSSGSPVLTVRSSDTPNGWTGVCSHLVCQKILQLKLDFQRMQLTSAEMRRNVELDEITVRQEIVEVALDPSMLLYVNNSKPSTVNINQQTSASSQRIIIAEKPTTDLSALKRARIKPRGDPVPIAEQGNNGDSSGDASNDENDNDNVPSKNEDSKWDSYPCDVCGMAFRQRSHLATHKRKHMTERRFKCNDCGSCFKTKSSLHFHMKRHSEAPFVCGPCNKVYPERKQLMRHIRVVHTSVNRYPCDQCDKAFKTRQKHDLHYTLHTGEKPFICDLCQKAFVYKSTFVQHMNSHAANKEFKCDKCPKEYSVCAEFKRHYVNHTDFRPFKCTVCSKSFPLKGTLKNHMKIHAPEKPYKCSRCDKSFMKKQSLDCHMMLHEGQSPQFMCDQCSQSYYNVFALKRHYLKHTGERGFRCEVCHKAFWMKDALRVHMRTHSNVKMFPCKECHKAFSHKHTLDSHMKIHAGVASHICHFCHKTFIHKANLTRHIRLHETNQISNHSVTR